MTAAGGYHYSNARDRLQEVDDEVDDEVSSDDEVPGLEGGQCLDGGS